MKFPNWVRQAVVDDYSERITRLRAAILKGDFSESDLLEERWREISALTDGAFFEDSLDTVEFVTAAEEKDIAMRTVGDLLRFLEQQQRERDNSTL
jgi:acyl carrier protein